MQWRIKTKQRLVLKEKFEKIKENLKQIRQRFKQDFKNTNLREGDQKNYFRA